MKKILILIPILFFLQETLAQQIPDGYYDNAADLDGQELKEALHRIIRGHEVYSYADFRDTILPDLDEDPENSNNILLFYKGASIPKSEFASNNQPDFWNREHTWPKSHGFASESDTAYTDVHNLRPSDATVNTSKSNKDFNDVEHIAENEEGEAPDTYTTSDFFEPRPEVKGDVARILFYMSTRYESERLDLELVDRVSGSSDPELGVLFTLIKWHEEDPVDQTEIDRHEGAYDYQGNRNPFVDHPEWVASIWGTASDPYLSFDKRNFNEDFGEVALGESLIQSYSISAYNLESDLTVSVTSPFSISLDGTTFSESVTIVNDGSDEQVQEVYIQYEPAAEDEAVEATVIHATTGIEQQFDISGQEGSIEVISILEAREMSIGSVVSFTGVVIDARNNSDDNRVVYDGTAGIVVRSFDSGNESDQFTLGDSIKVTGGLGDYNNLLEIETSPITIELLKSGAELPEPQLVTIDQIGEEHESELVMIENVSFSSAGGTFQGGGSAGNFVVTDETGSLTYRIGSASHPIVGEIVPASKCTIVGFIGQYFDDYQISPRTIDDITIQEEEVLEVANSTAAYLVYPNPTDGLITLKGLGEEPAQVRVFDYSGRLVLADEIEFNELDLSQLKSGLYTISVRAGAKVFQRKLIKK